MVIQIYIHTAFLPIRIFFFFFFYKNNHYQAEISHNFKKMLRTYAGWESVKRVFNSLILLFGKPNSARVSKSWFVRHLVHGIKASRTTRWQATWYHMTANNAFCTKKIQGTPCSPSLLRVLYVVAFSRY